MSRAVCTGMLVLAEVELIFLYSSWYGASFWICAENNVDNTGILLSQGLFRFSPHPNSK